MFRVCTNMECNQKYKIKPDMLGAMARCKKCNTVFSIEEHVQRPKILNLEPPEDETATEESSDSKRQRRSPKEVMEEKIELIKLEVDRIIPRLKISYEKKENESDTRLLINKMIQNILGYKIEDIKTEQKIEGRKADYVLSVKNEDVIVMEAKKIGMSLRDRHIFQATSYGAYSGIKWAILTNALVWQLYHVSTGDKIETELIFSIDLMDGLDDEEAQCFYLISKHGMSRKNLLENLWRKISALCPENIVNAILTDEVIAKIRRTLKKQTGYKVSDDDLRTAIEENILQL